MASSIVIAAYGTAFGTARKGIARLFGRLNYNRSSIREHFSHSVHDLVRIVAHSDHRVGADFACVLDHYFESFGARYFTEAGECGDVSSDQRVQCAAQRSKDRARAYGDASHDTKCAHYSEAIQREGRCHHVLRERVPLRHGIRRVRVEALLCLIELAEFISHSDAEPSIVQR